MLENIGVEVVVRLGQRLGASEMFGDDAGTRARGTKGLELRDGRSKCYTKRLAKQAKVAGIFGNGRTLQASQWAGPGRKFLSPAQTRPKPWRARPKPDPDPKKPGPPKQPKLFMNRY